MDKLVRVYDENDALVGDVEFFEALQAAKAARKDLVLRQEKAQPPVVKILNYRMELLKRLFQKLGKQMSEKEEKSKSFILQTQISLNDLNNKKRKAIEFLKKHSYVKFYMKVNVFDNENIKKGQEMLNAVAEDLKQYAKVKKSSG